MQDNLVFILILTARAVENNAILTGVYMSIAILVRPHLLDDVRRRVREDDVPQNIVCDRAEPGHGDTGADDEMSELKRTGIRHGCFYRAKTLHNFPLLIVSQKRSMTVHPFAFCLVSSRLRCLTVISSDK